MERQAELNTTLFPLPSMLLTPGLFRTFIYIRVGSDIQNSIVGNRTLAPPIFGNLITNGQGENSRSRMIISKRSSFLEGQIKNIYPSWDLFRLQHFPPQKVTKPAAQIFNFWSIAYC